MRRLLAVTVFCAAAWFCSPAHADLKVDWMRGAPSPGTPARYDKVGVIKVGSPRARNVLVLEPGTSAGAAYFAPLAQWIVARAPKWQVWSVERRENLLEDQSMLNLAKAGLATSAQLFDYYLGWLDPALQVQSHIQPIPNASVTFAKGWGMSVAVGDLRRVIDAARKLGGKVVLGGHSLGGAVVTAYATWDFDGRAGADDLGGLAYIDGGSLPAVSAPTARRCRGSIRPEALRGSRSAAPRRRSPGCSP
jgi:pimeloyl-ACP methyl ester carboxylesterase